MEIIALSNPEKNKQEADIIQQMFEAGLSSYHLRKRGLSLQEIVHILDEIDSSYRNRIVLHGHPSLALQYGLKGVHVSTSYLKPGLVSQTRKHFMALRYRSMERSITCHSLDRLESTRTGYTSLVLSPVFNTISDHNISAGFDESSIRKSLSRVSLPVIALGGIDTKTILQAKEMGFSGAMLQGALWRNDHPVQTYLEVKQALLQPVRERSPLSVVKPAVRSA